MFRLTSRKIVILAACCFVGLAVLQIFWLGSAFDAEMAIHKREKKQFEFELESELRKNEELKAGLKSFLDYYRKHQRLDEAQMGWFYLEFVNAIELAPKEEELHVYLDGFSIVKPGAQSTSKVTTLLSTIYERPDPSQIKEAGKICIGCIVEADEKLRGEYDHQLLLFYKKPWAGFFENLGFLIILSLTLLVILGVLFNGIIKKYREEKKLSEAKNDFINNMTHEMQTPVFAIQMANKLIEQKTDEETAPLTKIIEKEAGQLKQHAAKILELASLERGQVELDKVLTELNSLIDEKRPTIELMLMSRKGKLKINFAGKELYAALDVVHFNNILVSLVDNAIKYSDKAPQITIETGESAKMNYLRISDEGIGIKKDYLPYVFDKFYRVPTVKNTGITGFGLGLSYVKHIIDLHKGEVTISSDEGKGTTITICLPKVSRHA